MGVVEVAAGGGAEAVVAAGSAGFSAGLWQAQSSREITINRRISAGFYGTRYTTALMCIPAPTDAKSGWQVMIDNGSGPDFREHVIFYHEIGDEAFRPLNEGGCSLVK